MNTDLNQPVNIIIEQNTGCVFYFERINVLYILHLAILFLILIFLYNWASNYKQL